jgi:TPR repeat protein
LAPKVPSSPGEDVLVSRADALLRDGDVSGARLLLERAMDGGSVRGAFRLAETYDPSVLARWGARGLRADPVKAREFYTRALAGGFRQAKERLDSLQ